MCVRVCVFVYTSELVSSLPGGLKCDLCDMQELYSTKTVYWKEGIVCVFVYTHTG